MIQYVLGDHELWKVSVFLRNDRFATYCHIRLGRGKHRLRHTSDGTCCLRYDNSLPKIVFVHLTWYTQFQHITCNAYEIIYRFSAYFKKYDQFTVASETIIDVAPPSVNEGYQLLNTSNS